jgi:hypothetical protein
MEETKFISFRVPLELAEQAKHRAKTQHRSLQGHMLHLIENDLAKSPQISSSKPSNLSPDVDANVVKPQKRSAGGSSTATTDRSRRTG